METEILSNQESSNQSSPEAIEPSPAAEGGSNLPAVQEKSGLEKLRDKGSVNVAAKAPETAVTTALAAFKPNFKFKAAGKEMEVPEYLRGVMKDADTEKHLTSLLSKAHGIEMIQDKLKTTREDRDQFKAAYTQVMEPINYGREAYKRGDLDTVFQVLAMDPQKVLQWAVKKVQLSQLPADQRQVHEAAERSERQAWELQRKAEIQAQTGSQAQGDQITQMVDLILERPDFSALAQAYDAKRSKEGSFRDLVFQMGDQEYRRTGKVIPPMEAAKMAVELLGEKLGAPALAAVSTQAPAAQPAAAAEKPKITLPNAGGSKSAAPAKAKVKSLDDLRKLHKEMASN